MNKTYNGFIYANNKDLVGAQCLLQTSSLSPLFNWNDAYARDQGAYTNIKALILHKVSSLSASFISSTHKGYRKNLNKGMIIIVDNTLLLRKPINIEDKRIRLIIVPVEEGR